MAPSESLRKAAEQAIKNGLPGFSYGGYYPSAARCQRGKCRYSLSWANTS